MLIFYLNLIDDEDKKYQFTDLYLSHYKLMFAIAFEKSNNKQAAEDIVHNAFVRIIKILNENKLDVDKNVEGYLATITSNEANRYWQKHKNETVQEDDILFSYMPKANYTVECVEIEQLVRDIMALDEKYKEPLKLYAAGYPVKEIAQTLQLSESNVKQRLSRGRKMLLSTLEV